MQGARSTDEKLLADLADQVLAMAQKRRFAQRFGERVRDHRRRIHVGHRDDVDVAS